ncbi:glycerate kinase [Paenibacillus lycopersici]|uniref:Glycerate kinase n=1 Tax=Paenibacillus lycopersici TaxID=2704462 RepID=A0A6C0G6P1_9BACL|nr:glycerate kinase [Paenibacillus lycopersici]QHT61495.1 glycerate kinase [Paenibacillus lycopersici]
MKVVLAPDSFKESMSAYRAAAVMREAIQGVAGGSETEIVELPVADGGEGTLDVLIGAMRGRLIDVEVTDPLGGKAAAHYGLSGDGGTAVVEMAQASGLQLVPPEARNPLLTTTYGTGELIGHALSHGTVRRMIITIGGSATNDCGAGMLQALGARLLDAGGREIGRGGGELPCVAAIDLSGLDKRLREVRIAVACDVTNPLVGPRGASQVFGPQKGASPQMAMALDAALSHFADRIAEASGLRLHDVPGAGAAGGLGAALMLCGGKLEPGIELVLDAVDFDAHLEGADYVLTGEGRIDGQTPNGKVIAGIVKRARKAGVPVLAFAGSLQPGYESLYEAGLQAAFGITTRPMPLEDALKQGEQSLHQAVANVMRLVAGTKR